MANSKPSGEVYQVHQSTDFNGLVRELNGLLTRISSRLDKIQGISGNHSQFVSDINMTNHRITSLADPSSGDDAQKKKLSLSRSSDGANWNAEGRVINGGAEGNSDSDLTTLGQVRKEIKTGGASNLSTATPLEVETVAVVGTATQAAHGDHVHSGVNLTDAQTVGGVKTFSSNPIITNTAPGLAITDTTAAAKSLTVAVDANLADLRESAGAAQTLLQLDLANNYVVAAKRLTIARGTATAAGGSAEGLYFGNALMGVFWGSGAPSISVPKGSLYLRTDGGGVNDRAYIATDAVGTWVAVVTTG